MVKVRVARDSRGSIGIGAVPLSLALLNTATTAACSAPAEAPHPERSASTSSALTDGGAGTLSLQYWYGPNGPSLLFNATNSTDEFVRVGETMTATIPAWYLWNLAHPNDPAPDADRAKQLTAQITVFFQSQGVTLATATLGIRSWTSSTPEADFWSLTAVTSDFRIPAGTDTLDFALDIADLADASASAHETSAAFAEIAVFGGDPIRKHAVFDIDATTLRERVIEGGDPVRGADLQITYTDWRANTIVDSYSLDRNIGTARVFGRFGAFEMPITGDLAYEISYGWFADDGGGWRGESLLPANKASRVLGANSGRTAFETTIYAPDGATKLDFYFRVKVYVVADYARWGEVTYRRYNQGDRILLRDRYDNMGGVPFQNYELPLEDRPR